MQTRPHGWTDTPRAAILAAMVAISLPSKPALAASSTDFDKPLVTSAGTLVCSFAAALDPREGKGLDAAMKSRLSTFGRQKEAEAAGCEEWREGIPVRLTDKGRQRARDFQARQRCGMVEGASQLFFSCDLRNTP